MAPTEFAVDGATWRAIRRHRASRSALGRRRRQGLEATPSGALVYSYERGRGEGRRRVVSVTFPGRDVTGCRYDPDLGLVTLAGDLWQGVYDPDAPGAPPLDTRFVGILVIPDCFVPSLAAWLAGCVDVVVVTPRARRLLGTRVLGARREVGHEAHRP